VSVGTVRRSSVSSYDEQALGETRKYRGIAHKTYVGVPHVSTGTVGPARASLATLTLHDIWSMYDQDRDGWLTEAQVNRALAAVGVALSDDEKRELRRELEEDLALWSDSDDAPTDSDASVSSDDDDAETVYEDHAGVIKALRNDPPGTVRLLKASHHHAPLFSPVAEGREALHRDRPQQIAAWCAATATPGRAFAASVLELQARTAFFERVHECQMAYEAGALLGKQEAFEAPPAPRPSASADPAPSSQESPALTLAPPCALLFVRRSAGATARSTCRRASRRCGARCAPSSLRSGGARCAPLPSYHSPYPSPHRCSGFLDLVI